MDDKQAKHQISRIKKLVEKWGWIGTKFGWVFDVCYHDSHAEMPHDIQNPQTVAVAYCRFRYLSANIHFNLELVSQQKDDELENTVVHELCHMLTAPMLDVEDLPMVPLELATTQIARALLHRDGWDKR